MSIDTFIEIEIQITFTLGAYVLDSIKLGTFFGNDFAACSFKEETLLTGLAYQWIVWICKETVG
jgi:hypothetical protein